MCSSCSCDALAFVNDLAFADWGLRNGLNVYSAYVGIIFIYLGVVSLCVVEWNWYSGIPVLTNCLCLAKILFR